MLGNLKSIEKQVFRAYWDDGLLDLFGAIAVLFIGMSWIIEMPVFGAMVPALLVPLWIPLRQRLVEPRLGLVEFSDERVQRNTERLRSVAVFGAGTLVLAIALYFARLRLGINPTVPLIAALPALLIAVLAAMTAFLIATPRFMLYAAVLALTGVAGALLGLEPGPILAIAAVPLLVVALLVLVRFLRDNPVDGEPQ